MNGTPPPYPRLFEPARHGRTAAELGALMIASALTESAGIMLLVPMLAALGSSGSGGRIARLLARIGVPLRLDLLLGAIVVLALLRGLINARRQQCALRLEFSLVDGLRNRAWRALLHCDWRVLLGMNKANSASLLITQIDQTGVCVNQAISALATLATLGGIGIAALAISPLVSAGALLAGVAVLAAYHRMRARAQALGEEMGAAYGNIYGELQEGLGALRVIKSHGREERAAHDLAAQFGALRAAQMAYMKDLGRGDIALQAGGALVLAVLVWAALTRWHSDVATILPMVALFARALPLLGVLQQTTIEWSHSRPAVKAALDLIATAEAARESGADRTAPPQPFARALSLDQVSVRFGAGRAALDGVTLTIPPRGITALIGASGAGKSTLADLVGGLLSPDTGTIAIDGVTLEGAVRRGWRQRVAYVQQEAVLSSGSVRDNLLWAAPEASDAALEAALRDAAGEFALALPQGLDTLIGDGKRTLSGGERQRLVLARALLRDPALLILDEATSALDAENEAHVARAVAALGQRMAVLIIGHRGALLDLADQTITLDAGRVVAVQGR